MQHLFDLLFPTPTMPHAGLPWALEASGFGAVIAAAFKLVYQRGVYDGFIAGVLLTLLLVPHVRRRGGD